MNLKKLVLAAALLIMIPAQIACATSSMLPNNAPGTVVELKKETPDFSKDPFKHWYGWWGEKKTDRAMITVTRGEMAGTVLKSPGRATNHSPICGC